MLKIVIIVLCSINIGLGIYGLYLIHRLENKFKK